MKDCLISNREGMALVTTALALVTVFGFAAIGVDVGAMLTSRNQLQNAVDAAALAGASGLLVSQSEAQNRAIQLANSNLVLGDAVTIDRNEISFPTASQVRVQRNSPVNLFFARVIGITSVNISAMATADLTNLSGTSGFRPFVVPEKAWAPGQIVTLKLGNQEDPGNSNSDDDDDNEDREKSEAKSNRKSGGDQISDYEESDTKSKAKNKGKEGGSDSQKSPSFYQAISFPPVNRGTPQKGASAYKDRIINGYPEMVYIGDEILLEPGMMAGPTQQGVKTLMATDPDARWNGSSIVNSNFPELSSPRVIKVPMFDADSPPPKGRKTIVVTNMAAFFVLAMEGNSVKGVFLNKVTSGESGSSPTFLKKVRLIN